MSASIHFPLAREDKFQHSTQLRFNMLQSTSLLRGKTIICKINIINYVLQSTSLLRGKTYKAYGNVPVRMLQSTSLLRGKTITDNSVELRVDASIHFPLAREDLHPRQVPAVRDSFNPLPSCEGRQYPGWLSLLAVSLQSTSLLRGKTSCSHNYSVYSYLLQSTSLLRGKTRSNPHRSAFGSCFNPLPSCEGRRESLDMAIQALELQSTSLLRGKTEKGFQTDCGSVASIHFPLAREDERF